MRCRARGQAEEARTAAEQAGGGQVGDGWMQELVAAEGAGDLRGKARAVWALKWPGTMAWVWWSVGQSRLLMS